MAAEEDKGAEKNRKPEEAPAAPVTPVAPPAAAPGWVVPPNLRRAPLVPGTAPAPRPAAAPAPRPPAAPPPAPPPAAVPPPAALPPASSAASGTESPPAPRVELPPGDRPPLLEPHLDRIDPPARDEGSRGTEGIEPQLGPVAVPPDPPKPKRWSKLPPPLMARTTDRLMDEGEKPRRYGAWIVLGVVILLGAGGFWLWREGRLEPILTPAHNLIAKIESYFPGAEPETTTPAGSASGSTTAEGTPSSTTANRAASTAAAPTAAAPDAAMVQEIKQLLAKLNLSPGPIDGNLDQATQDAIRSYQEMAGEPVTGQPSQALLTDLRVVVAYQQPPG